MAGKGFRATSQLQADELGYQQSSIALREARGMLHRLDKFTGPKHLKSLENAGLITRSREAQYRPCKLAAEPLKDISEWIERYRKHWEESFDRLDAYLKELQKKKEDE